jgi:hypothetical protein
MAVGDVRSGSAKVLAGQAVRRTVSVVLAVVSISGGHPAVAADLPLALESRIPLDDVVGRIDHLAVDPIRHRLYVAELGNGSIGVVDLEQRTLLRTLGGFAEPQGIAYEPTTDTLYVASGGDGSVSILRGADLERVAAVRLGADADNVRVDRVSRQVIVGYGAGALAAIDVTDHKTLARFPLDGHPEGFQLGPHGDRIFVNVPSKGEVAVIDRATGKQTSTWSTSSRAGNYPLAIDARRQRVLVGFRKPPVLGAFASEDGTLLGTVEICGDADDVFVDAKRDLVYVTCGEGYVDVLAAGNAGYVTIGRVPTASGARTALFDPERDRLMVAARATKQTGAEIWIFRPEP